MRTLGETCGLTIVAEDDLCATLDWGARAKTGLLPR
jgi:hypothetical protein